jgi:hypothetical protein
VDTPGHAGSLGVLGCTHGIRAQPP